MGLNWSLYFNRCIKSPTKQNWAPRSVFFLTMGFLPHSGFHGLGFPQLLPTSLHKGIQDLVLWTVQEETSIQFRAQAGLFLASEMIFWWVTFSDGKGFCCWAPVFFLQGWKNWEILTTQHERSGWWIFTPNKSI